MTSLIHRVLRHIPAGWRRRAKRLPGLTGLRDRLYGMPHGPEPAAGFPRPVVYLPTWLEWHVMKQRPQYVLEALARAGHPIWFVDPRAPGPDEADSGITIVPTLRDVPRSHVIIYTHFAPVVSLIERFDNPAVVYDVLDDLSIYDADEMDLPAERTVRHHHGGLITRADVVTVSNSELFQKHQMERTDLVLLENGVDLDLFDPEGDVFGSLPDKPIVGYHGAISLWFDFELVEALARTRPDLSVLLVGPVDDRVAEHSDQLARLPNLHLFPQQSVEDIVKFVRGFDVGIIPFRVNEMTRGVTPLKMYEYLAMGVPCVATPLPACVAHKAVGTAASPVEFATEVDRALGMSADAQSRLRVHAEEASWDRRIEDLLDRLDSDGLRTVPVSDVAGDRRP